MIIFLKARVWLIGEQSNALVIFHILRYVWALVQRFLFGQELFMASDDLLNCRRIVQRAQVSQTVQVALHNFPQHAPHNLPRTRLRKPFRKLQQSQ